MTRVRFPGRLETSTKLFGQFTFKDLARLLLPATIVYTTAPTPVLFGVAAVTGVAWYWAKPFNQHLDQLAYNSVRWLVEKKTTNYVYPKAENTYVKTNTGRAAIIQVSATNLDMKTGPEQGALHNIYQDLLDKVNYPLHIHSVQTKLSLEDYAQEIAKSGNGDEYLREDYVEFCHNLSDRDLSKTTHYIVLRAEQETSHCLKQKLPVNLNQKSKTAKGKLDDRSREVTKALNTGEIQAERLKGRKISQTADRISITPPGTAVLEEKEEAGISPAWASDPKRYSSNNHYRKTLYVSEYPASLEMGWPLHLLRTDGLVDVVQVVEPRDPGKATKKLQNLSEKLNAEINSFLSQGYRGTNKLESLLEDTEWILDLLADRKASPVDYGVYITSHSDSQQKALQTHRQVKNRLNTQQLQYENTVLRTDQAYKTDQPLLRDALNETQLVPSNSAAAGFPFGTQQNSDEHGVIHGIDTSDDTPILADRFQWSSHSTARMGMVGSGKSYTAKLELIRSSIVYDNLQIIVVDPKKEYDQLIKKLGGVKADPRQTHGLKQAEGQHLCFQVEERGQEENVDQLVDLVREIYSYTSKNQDKTLVLIDEARILMNDEEGRQVLNQFILEARDTNTAITLISQNASHFTHCREGREILDNMPAKVFMRHERVPDSVADYFQLSDRERQELYELKTGTDAEYSEALLKISGKLDTRIRIESTDYEHRLINRGDNQ